MKFTYLRSVHIFISVQIHVHAQKKSTLKKVRLAPHTEKYGVKNASFYDFYSLSAWGDTPAWSVGAILPSPGLLRQGVRVTLEKKRLRNQ